MSATAAVTTEPGDAGLGRRLRGGLAWSFLNNVLARAGSFLSGIVIARILVPEDFGVYAVGLVVLNVLLSMNELGVSVALIRRPGPVDAVAPTVVTLSLVSSALLTAAVLLLAPVVAGQLQAPSATGVIRVLALAVLVDGLASVPNALLTRDLRQRTRLHIDLIAFAVGTPVIIGLALAGYGAWSLAWGALLGNLVSGGLAVLWAPARYRPGFDAVEARALLRFGLPLAGASLLLFATLNVDYVVIGRYLGPEQLGLYLLAFNLCGWPVTIVSTSVRRVSLPAFARLAAQGQEAVTQGGRRALGLVVVLTAPLCALLGLYASDLIGVVYGSTWARSAHVLPALAVLGLGRVLIEIGYDYLVALGRTTTSLWLHAVWLVALVPALVWGARVDGILGVGRGHAAVMVLVVCPLVAAMLHHAGLPLLALARDLVAPAAGVVVLAVVAVVVHRWVDGALLRAGGGLGVVGYAAVVARPTRTHWRLLTSPAPV